MKKPGPETVWRLYGLAADLVMILTVLLVAEMTHVSQSANPALEVVRKYWLTIPSAAALLFLLRMAFAKGDGVTAGFEMPPSRTWVYWAVSGSLALWCVLAVRLDIEGRETGPFLTLLLLFGGSVGDALYEWISDSAGRDSRPSRNDVDSRRR